MRRYTINDTEFNKLLAHMDKTIKHDAELIKILERLITGLKTYEGKMINVRIEKPAQQTLIEYKVHYSKWHEHYYLYIAKDQERFQISLMGYCREKTNRFNLEYLTKVLKDLKVKHEKDKEGSLNVTEIVSKYNTALTWFYAAETELTKLPGWYNFSKY